MESQATNETGTDTTTTRSIDGPPAFKSNQVLLFNYGFRFVAFLLAFISAVVMGAAKETVVLSSSTVRNGIIKSTDFAAYVYFLIANVIVLMYSIASIVLLLFSRGVLSRIAIPLSIGDLIMVVLLFSCNGAAGAVSVLSDNGQPNIGWNHFCTVLTTFCGRVEPAIVLSIIAAVVYLLLVVFALVGTHRHRRV